MTPPLLLVPCAAPGLWDQLLAACLALPHKGTRRRTNLSAGPRDRHGLLLDPIPSDLVSSGPVVAICAQMLPGQPINEVMVNRFTDHEQCRPHQDVNNTEDSFIALDGPFEGGGLAFEDGQVFAAKRQWLRYPGHRLTHWVQPFQGTRVSVVPFFRSNRHRAGGDLLGASFGLAASCPVLAMQCLSLIHI